jgi:hypothetical protein
VVVVDDRNQITGGAGSYAAERRHRKHLLGLPAHATPMTNTPIRQTSRMIVVVSSFCHWATGPSSGAAAWRDGSCNPGERLSGWGIAAGSLAPVVQANGTIRMTWNVNRILNNTIGVMVRTYCVFEPQRSMFYNAVMEGGRPQVQWGDLLYQTVPAAPDDRW